MKGALLVGDHIRDDLVHIDGEYPDMFAKLLPELELAPYWVCDGHFPDSAGDYDFYICSGSKFSVYDDIPWIKQLNQFTLKVFKANKKYIGSCFGHQMIAQALGGKVEKAKVGWSIGVGEFQVTSDTHWMQPKLETFRLLLMCQDQVTKLPKGSEVHASSDRCPVAIFSIENRFLGIQPHPEFSKAYNEALYTSRSETIGDEIIVAAASQMHLEIQTGEVVEWIMSFLKS